MNQSNASVVIGIGNPILSDDGIGWQVADLVEALLRDEHAMPADDTIQVLRVCVGGLALAEALIGYERAVIIDAILVSHGAPGTIYQLNLSDLPGTLNTASAHDLTLMGALRLLRQFGAILPADEQIQVIGIAVQDVWTFAQGCTASVARSVPLAARVVLDALNHSSNKSTS